MKKAFILLALLGCLMATAQEFKGEYVFEGSTIVSYIGYDSLGENEEVFSWAAHDTFVYVDFDNNKWYTFSTIRDLDRFIEFVKGQKENGNLKNMYRVKSEKLNNYADPTRPILRLRTKGYTVKQIGKYRTLRIDLNLNSYTKL